MSATLETPKESVEEEVVRLRGEIYHVTERANRAAKGWAEESEKARMLRLVVKGIAADQFYLKVTLSPEMFDSRSFDIVQELIRQHARATVYELEQKIGWPGVRLRDALMHIHYLENHAQNRGLPFKPFGISERDKSLMDTY